MELGQNLQKDLLLGAIDFQGGCVLWKSSEKGKNKTWWEKTRNGTTGNKGGFQGSLPQISKSALKGSFLALLLDAFYDQISAISNFSSLSKKKKTKTTPQKKEESFMNAAAECAHPCHTQGARHRLSTHDGNGKLQGNNSEMGRCPWADLQNNCNSSTVWDAQTKNNK